MCSIFINSWPRVVMSFPWLIDVASDVRDNLCNVENDVKRRFYIVAFFITSILICTLF